MYTPETTYEEFLKKEQEKYPELNLKDIEVLKERCKANPELPLLRAKEYVMFLHGCNFDVDAAYKTIVIHYKYRSELPQIFSKVDPASEEMKKVFETMSMSIVTKSNSGREECIVYTHFKNPDPQQYDYVKSVRYFFMLMEYVMVTNGTFDGLILTMNGKHMSWRHITKTPIHLLKKLLGFVQEALPIRLKEVHVLNAGSIVTMLFNLTKPFMASGFIDKVTLYPEGSKEIFKHVPIEIMPTEMGGNGKSHYEYCEETFDQMLSFRDWYMTLDLVPQ